MGNGGRFVISKRLLLVGFVWLLLVGNLEGGGGGEMKQSRNLKKKINDGIVVEKSDMINSMNKRRVPNGPDPIHNRRAGNSGRPPGQA